MIAAVRSGRFKFIRVNYANGDMVGHTGIVNAIRIAVEAVDLSLQRLLPVVRAAGGVLVVTADHGNADCMFTEKKGKREAMVAHTLNPVPFVVKDFSDANALALSGVPAPGLSNVAATLLTLLGFQKPADYDPSLVRHRVARAGVPAGVGRSGAAVRPRCITMHNDVYLCIPDSHWRTLEMNAAVAARSAASIRAASGQARTLRPVRRGGRPVRRP